MTVGRNHDDDLLTGCEPGRWIGVYLADGRRRQVDQTRDDEAWLLVLFATVLGDDEAIRRKAEQWRELFKKEPF